MYVLTIHFFHVYLQLYSYMVRQSLIFLYFIYILLGAGRFPTANSVLNDLIRLSLDKTTPPFPINSEIAMNQVSMCTHVCSRMNCVCVCMHLCAVCVCARVCVNINSYGFLIVD